MRIPPKGTLERSWTVLTVLVVVRPMRPVVRWLNHQRWVAAYAEWDEKHVPSWFTIWNVLYLGFACYAALVLYAIVAGKV